MAVTKFFPIVSRNPYKRILLYLCLNFFETYLAHKTTFLLERIRVPVGDTYCLWLVQFKTKDTNCYWSHFTQIMSVQRNGKHGSTVHLPRFRIISQNNMEFYLYFKQFFLRFCILSFAPVLFANDKLK